jgi:hypothetical protein
MTTKIQHKLGDTFAPFGVASVVQYTAAGALTITNFTGWTIASQLRTTLGGLIETLSATWLDASTGKFQITSPSAQLSWTAQPVLIDIQFKTPAGDIASTESASFDLVQGVTHVWDARV